VASSIELIDELDNPTTW